jgi:uncharacterized cupredoxin-like copper-binding protein
MTRLAAAALLSIGLSVPAFAQVPHAAEIVKNALWDKMETVTIELVDHDFLPKDLTLKANQPYRIVIKNTGEKDHYYTAAEFFKDAVAWRKVQTPRPGGGEIKAPYFTAVEAYKNGGQVELFIVPVKKGKYEVVCTIDDHKDRGMFGSITIE